MDDGPVRFTQEGGELNVVVTGVNVGAQLYWNAEASMLMRTRGILIMTAPSAMVLTGTHETREIVRAAKRAGAAAEFDRVHDARRALGVGSIDRIIPPWELRPFVISALDRGLATAARDAT